MNDSKKYEKESLREARKPRFWMGGVCSTFSVFFSHPMDLLKVTVQITNKPANIIAKKIYTSDGFRGFYQGATASMARQMGSTGSRIAMYDLCRSHFNLDTFIAKVLLAASTGVVGSLVGFPPDVVNVRIQSDASLPYENRRQYKNVFDGIYKIYKTEGFYQLYSGGTIVIIRGMMVSICSTAVYDQLKQSLRQKYNLSDSGPLHFVCSFFSAVVGTTLTQPLDIIKTRIMAAPRGHYKNVWDVFIQTKKHGIKIFYSGYLLNFMRICPHTVITFMLMEQLRLKWGYIPEDTTSKKH